MTSSRGSINAMPVTITSESSTSPVEFNMATVCKICAGPIEPPDQHYHCVVCLGLAHGETTLDESNCGHCAGLPARVLRACRDMVRGLFGVRPTAASVGPPPLLVAGALSCRAAKPNGRPIPRFPSPRTASAPLLTSRSLYPLARRRGMTPCPSRPRRGRIGRDRSPIKWTARGLQTSKRSS